MNATALAPTNSTETTALETLMMEGDLSRLTAPQRLAFYQRVCSSLGLNPFTRPFDYIRLNNKLTLYAKRDAADQLRNLRGVSISIISQQTIGDTYVVTVAARDGHGREDSDIGAVNIKGLAGEALANAMMKAITKAKRRVTLSICGLGWLDETEVATIPDARPVVVTETGEIVDDTRMSKLRDKWAKLQTEGAEVGVTIPDMPADFETAFNAAQDWWASIEEARQDKANGVDADLPF